MVHLIHHFIVELPWDEPTASCLEYTDWKLCNVIKSPWNKIENLSLCEFFLFLYSCH